MSKNKILAFPGVSTKAVALANKAIMSGDVTTALSFLEQTSKSEVNISKLKSKSCHEQLSCIVSLQSSKLVNYLSEIKQFLSSAQNPILQTLLLSTLNEQNIEYDFVVNKLGKSVVYRTSSSQNIYQSEFLQTILSALKKTLEHENPSMYQQATSLVYEHNMVLFPIVLEDMALWTEMYILYFNVLFGIICRNDLTDEKSQNISFIESLNNYATF